MTALADLAQMVRPWYRGVDANVVNIDTERSFGHHIYVDCEWLADEGEPREGVGWLNPYGSDVCENCRWRHDVKAYEEWAADEYA